MTTTMEQQSVANGVTKTTSIEERSFATASHNSTENASTIAPLRGGDGTTAKKEGQLDHAANTSSFF
eukprot:CAMPEP_0119556024 /NCGR_PEP_ID=MMETSP1352-20130426/8085_1 /TAXON_ID=265584 /ORGANISM="Stauroneis constricta, Strain CCMP1120" /LENGTH=66 /DNA_ID=CAMNT_0007602909 /DNA_START=59 /DNA_END=256 /DNA_ORIENTATION=+